VNLAAFGISAIGVPWALLATFKIAPAFTKMFADFGSELPFLTQLMVRPWAPLALSLASLALVGASHRFAEHAVPITVAIVTTLVQPAIFVAAMYLPIFSVASTIS
jgi:type II secretory pathway component PulF